MKKPDIYGSVSFETEEANRQKHFTSIGTILIATVTLVLSAVLIFGAKGTNPWAIIIVGWFLLIVNGIYGLNQADQLEKMEVVNLNRSRIALLLSLLVEVALFIYMIRERIRISQNRRARYES